ncbi:uncharacterized protein LOC143463503 isoform X2 [Clavelina lepadiformis]|uniref:uncharacterized protein LOC143463503 isoform X2 n=1 Tax=Clavelina lepadiformis TaxID=159417 RepID=UPI00404238D7
MYQYQVGNLSSSFYLFSGRVGKSFASCTVPFHHSSQKIGVYRIHSFHDKSRSLEDFCYVETDSANSMKNGRFGQLLQKLKRLQIWFWQHQWTTTTAVLKHS